MDRNNDSLKNLLHDLLREKHRNIYQRAIAFSAFTLLIYLVIFYLRTSNPNWVNSLPPLWQSLTDLLSTAAALFTTAIAVAWLSVTIEKETQETYRKIVAKTIIESQTLSEISINDMDTTDKENAIKLLVQSLLGNNNVSDQAMPDFILNNLRSAVSGWRSNFIYDTQLLNKPENETNYKLYQCLSYTQNYLESKQCNIKIGLAFDKKTLNEWLQEDGWFFRESIYDKPEEEGVRPEDKQSALSFLTEIGFELKISTDKSNPIIKTLTVKDIEIRKGKGIVIKFSPSQKTNQFSASVSFLKNTPNRYFLVVLPMLTENANISMRFDGDKVDVNGHHIFTCSRNDTELSPNKIHRKCEFDVKQWLFPVSGVMFTWNEIENSIPNLKEYESKSDG